MTPKLTIMTALKYLTRLILSIPLLALAFVIEMWDWSKNE